MFTSFALNQPRLLPATSSCRYHWAPRPPPQLFPPSTKIGLRLCLSSAMLSAKIDLRVCVECLIGKQKKPILLSNRDRDQSQTDRFSRHQGNGCSQHSGPNRTEATRWQSIGCDPLKRRRSLLQRASTHQRLCRMVWALGMAACRSSQAVRPRGRRRCSQVVLMRERKRRSLQRRCCRVLGWSA